MRQLETETLPGTQSGVSRAAEILRTGGLVAFPTETVYGLGADATNGQAVAGIYTAKGRPSFNPLIVHVADFNAAEMIGEFGPEARRMAQALWPGPLTLVVPLRPSSGLSDLVTAGLTSVGLRVPAHPLAQALLQKADRPLAAPSANPSGRVSPTTAGHVQDGLDGRIDAILDGGHCTVGLESTILSFTGEHPQLLRPGGVTVEEIEQVLGARLADTNAPTTNTAPSAPGQLASHYAPRMPVRLGATSALEGELWLGFGPESHDADLNLSPTGDLTEAAANLFGYLRRLDARPGVGMAVAPIPETGLGLAINDRLRRAAAPRP